jgi:hypothetical protein
MGLIIRLFSNEQVNMSHFIIYAGTPHLTKCAKVMNDARSDEHMFDDKYM